MIRIFLVAGLALLRSLPGDCQNQPKTFTHDQMLDMVSRFHPVAAQAALLNAKGNSTIRQARGAFDPTLFGNYDQKQFSGKNYFSLLQTGFSIPTWYGLEFKTGYDYNTGQYLSSENVVPPNGLVYGGVKVSLAQGLLIDKRRADLKLAKLFAQSTGFERQKVLNQLYFDASKTYWKWMEAWNQVRVYEDGLQLAKERLRGVKQSLDLGDRPAIDTLETLLQVQNMELNRYQSRMNYRNATLELSTFLWYEDNVPLEITDSLLPPRYELISTPTPFMPDSLNRILNRLPSSHPDLQLYRNKLQSLTVERNLKTEYFKPKINLNYNLLSEPVGASEYTGLSTNNYKWGIDLRFPILLRQQRGDVELARIKIRETELGMKQKQLELENKVRSYWNEAEQLTSQVDLFRGMVINYTRMLDGERQRFNTGESSIFLVNARETSLVNARLKLIELTSKYQIARQGIQYAAGNLVNAIP